MAVASRNWKASWTSGGWASRAELSNQAGTSSGLTRIASPTLSKET
jgi:hypothetical protein